ncbi:MULTISPECIES: hypothetical protein [unclassified Aureimonas]|uniref:hypothetical protein n=1 Tax=unclassified Aureimonas TaxID=2615206 RepID=UPI000AFE4FA4|nr:MULTISPECIES: hypothetical protein [unclassified Aureimonas]
MTSVERRLVLHFPGFEPLDAHAHWVRFARSCRQSGAHWGLDVEVGALEDGTVARAFDATGRIDGLTTQSRIHLFDYDPLIGRLNGRPTPIRIATGFASAARVLWEGGLFGYLRHGWRFALFFLFPFLAISVALLVSLLIAALPLLVGWTPWHLLWSLPLAALFFARVFLPASGRWHMLHLLGDWDLAVELARMRDPALLVWLDAATEATRAALRKEADEIVVTSHSMGSGMAALVLGAVLEADPGALRGRRVVFLTLGGAILQSALLRSAKTLRAHVGRIARAPEIDWIEIQCLNDVVHFYRSNVVAACGHRDAPSARIVFIRVKQMLTAEHYRRIRRDALRVHRQYVLGSDKRSSYDFALVTTGPAPVALLAEKEPSPAEELRTAPPTALPPIDAGLPASAKDAFLPSSAENRAPLHSA